jgi:anti-sigma factor RsiW
MSCDFTERVSLLIDAELTPADTEQVRNHLSECPICQRAERDFTRLRHQIRSHEFESDPVAQRQTLWRILASQDIPLWHKKVALPAPVFAFVVVVLFALGAWLVYSRSGSTRPPTIERTGEPGARGPIEGGVDVSRFDQGQRAVIYKVRRAQSPGQ